jgi:uncharacterized protein (TIGR02646 family)
MQRLERAGIPTPACLANFQHPAQNWDDVAGQDKIEIRACLEQMQGRRCAYCEGPIDALGQHIEHFRRRAHYPQLTFAWENLYWSCYQDDSCGRYKDLRADPFDYADLIDPCLDNPDQFFLFRSDGTITVRPGLSAADRRKADETLRVFNLNPRWGRLRYMRKAAIAPYVRLAGDGLEFSADELRELFVDELREASSQPFFTAIRHALTEPL